MGFFEKAGREVEKFKQNAVDAAEEHHREDCPACDEPVPEDASECPHCGAELSKTE